jgi:hypothetical protein
VIVNTCDAMIALPGSNQEKKGTRFEIERAKETGTPVVLHPYWKTVKKTDKSPGPVVESNPMVQYFTDVNDAVNRAGAAISRSHDTTRRR